MRLNAMKITRLTSILVLLAALIVMGCEQTTSPVVDEPTQEENGENEGNENEGNDENGDEEGSDNEENGNEGGSGNEEDNSWIDDPMPMPEATYVLNERLAVSSYVSYSEGKRNDYMTFYQESTGYAVYLDIYTSESNTMLETGRYLLADIDDNAVYREWSYFTPYTNSDLIRFTDGWVEVIADAEHSSGYPYHKIRAYFDMENGDSISLEFEGTIMEK